MKNIFVVLITLILFGSCSSSKVIDQYSNPENSDFIPQKILVVGLAPNAVLQKQFEFTFVQALENLNIDAAKGVEFFGEDISVVEKYGEEMETLKDDLIEAGFDAVFFSRITGRDTKITFAQSYRSLIGTFEVIDEYSEKDIKQHNIANSEDYPIHHTETLFYCLCPDKENDLIWKGNIDIVNPNSSEEAIQDYVKALLKALRKSDVLPKR